MPRACVIVLDAVGAGALPDAAEFGDDGSDTLGNVARAVGGLDLPNLEALGLGNVEELEGCPPQAGAPAVAGRLIERSKGKDTTLGHWELMGIVTPQALPTYPHGFPHDVIDPFMHRTARGVLGNRPASGTEIIQELGEEHQETGKWIVYTSADSVFQIAAHEETIPLEELYEGCRAAREILTGKHAVGRVIARPFVGEPGNYERTPNRHDFSLEPRTPNYLTLLREAGVTVHGVGKIGDIFAGQDIDESHPTKSNVEGIQKTEELLQTLDEGFVFVNLVETDMLWGHRNDPVNFHRCLQDFDRRLPDLLDALRPGRPADRHLRPRLRPDHAVDRPLARARAAARLRPGQERQRPDPRGRVRRRRRDGELLAGRQGARTPSARTADRRAVSDEAEYESDSGAVVLGAGRSRDAEGVGPLNDPAVVAREYADESRLAARIAAQQSGDRPGPAPGARSRRSRRPSRGSCSRSAAAGASSPSGSQRELGARVVAVDQSERMVELTRARGVRGGRRRRPGPAVPRRRSSTARVAAWMLYHVPDLEPGAARAAARAAARRAARGGDEQRAHHAGALGPRRRRRRGGLGFSAENGEGALLRHFTDRRAPRRARNRHLPRPARPRIGYVASRVRRLPTSPTACRSSTARSSARVTSSSSSASRDPARRADRAEARRRASSRRRRSGSSCSATRAARSPSTRCPRS